MSAGRGASYKRLPMFNLMGPAFGELFSPMGPAIVQGDGATRGVDDPELFRVMGPADRQGHGATVTLAD